MTCALISKCECKGKFEPTIEVFDYSFGQGIIYICDKCGARLKVIPEEAI